MGESQHFFRAVLLWWVLHRMKKKVQWNGQPIIKESSVEIIPNVLTVKCMECDAGNKDNKTTTKTAFTRSKVVEERGDTQLCHEIVLCTNRLLKKDYAKSKDPTLLEQRKDLPPQSLAAVEEALTREIIKIREQSRQVKSDNNNDDSIPNKKKECEKFAAIEIEAARRAECFYEKKGSEVRKGSCLKPIGFSWLPKALQQNLLNRCVKATATKMTCREFGKTEGTQCVARVMENTTLNDDNKQQ